MPQNKKEVYKVVLIGDGGVGKTCLRNQYIHHRFTNRYKTTIGADFSTKELEKDGRKVMLQIWDTAGQERFQSLGIAYYRGADACILVYDVNNYLTFENLTKWRAEFLKYCGTSDPDNFPFVLVGNKVDLDDRVVSRRQVRAWIDSYSKCESNIPFFEASAKLGTNVDTIFQTLVQHIPETRLDKTIDNSATLRLQFSNNSPYRYDPYNRPESMYSQTLLPLKGTKPAPSGSTPLEGQSSRCCF
ncbi:hypothetical protein DSO57_1023460 [Entomophthora muscae]|uniref:Uncharacterized protein n=1 Tax=Entomophthora muscae TaxID=34485 RepID=A0ACC2RU01_9FUNG|nr:hypothetical protein DSO57_1023460 [Entomophthora muscae]